MKGYELISFVDAKAGRYDPVANENLRKVI